MSFSSRLGLLILLLTHLNVNAEEILLNPRYPMSYTVKKGDSLWDVASQFLQHPSQWAELWGGQMQMVYPNDTVHFSLENGKPRLNLFRVKYEDKSTTPSGTCIFNEDQSTNRLNFKRDKQTGIVEPCIRESKIDEPVRLIPLEKISAYLGAPKVVGARDLDLSPYVVDFAGEHLIAGAGDRLYARSILTNEFPSYVIYRAGQTYINPETGEILGYEAKHIAHTDLEKTGDPATLTITQSNSEIRAGDRLMPDTNEEITLNFFPHPPKKPINANIISIVGDGVSQIGRNNVVVIDKGKLDGVQVGHEFTVYKHGKKIRDDFSKVKEDMVRLPDEEAGTLMVFRPFERVSYALVMKAVMAIHLLDKAKSSE